MHSASRPVVFFSHGAKLQGFLTTPRPENAYFGVLFIHGGGRYSENLYQPWQEFMVKHGYSSFAFHSRGVGRSAGDFSKQSLNSRLEDAHAALAVYIATGTVDKTNIILVGSSMGAHVAVRLMSQVKGVKAIVLQSAAAYGASAESVSFGPEFTRVISQPKSYQGSPVFSLLKKFSGRAFVVYGAKDQIIPEAVKISYREALKSQDTYVELSRGRHALLQPKNKQEQEVRDALFQKTLEFMTAALS